jgi:hypothetical protein
VYANDDMFFGAAVRPEDLFRENKPIAFFFSEFYTQGPSIYKTNLEEARRLMKDAYGDEVGTMLVQQHQVKAFTVGLCRDTMEAFGEQIPFTTFRSENNVIFPYLCSLNGVHRGLAHERVLADAEVHRFAVTDDTFMLRLANSLVRAVYPRAKYVCFNDESSHTLKSVDECVTRILQTRYPTPSSFETKVTA